MEKICKKHGLTIHSLRTDGRYRCRKCSVDDVTKRRRKLKVMGVEYLGNKCSKCGYNKCIDALDYHHLDPEQKEYTIANGGNTRSWEKLKKELDKCILVCANCHREIHAELNNGVVAE